MWPTGLRAVALVKGALATGAVGGGLEAPLRRSEGLRYWAYRLSAGGRGTLLGRLLPVYFITTWRCPEASDTPARLGWLGRWAKAPRVVGREADPIHGHVLSWRLEPETRGYVLWCSAKAALDARWCASGRLEVADRGFYVAESPAGRRRARVMPAPR